jgi:hypothetical protein
LALGCAALPAGLPRRRLLSLSVLLLRLLAGPLARLLVPSFLVGHGSCNLHGGGGRGGSPASVRPPRHP